MHILSNESVEFIKKYVIPTLNIPLPLTEEDMDYVFSQAVLWEIEMVGDDGKDRIGEYPDKKRSEMADHFVTEASAYADEGYPDMNDLNKRLMGQ